MSDELADKVFTSFDKDGNGYFFFGHLFVYFSTLFSFLLKNFVVIIVSDDTVRHYYNMLL